MGEIKNKQLLDAIRQALREIRSSKSLTQEAVNNDIYNTKNVHIHTGRIETGKGNLSTSTVFALCEYYEIPISDFFAKVEAIDKGLKIKKKL